MFFELDSRQLCFPHPTLSEPDGLLAMGGDLRIARLRLAYAFGIFPWYSQGEPILWYAPVQRCVLFPDELHISKSMRPLLRNGHFHCSTDQAFDQVIHHCAYTSRHDQNGTWITNAMQQAYMALHLAGIAHSIEVWNGTKLVGGLYGVQHRNVFCGESMFSLESNASKFGLIQLCLSGQYTLIDCQVPNPHLLRMGAKLIDREQYMHWLRT